MRAKSERGKNQPGAECGQALHFTSGSLQWRFGGFGAWLDLFSGELQWLSLLSLARPDCGDALL
jgi:hypothetical protein